MQRYCTASIALLGFLASRRVEKSGWLAVMIIMTCFALLGVYFSGRQLWLHSLPPDAVPACMPSLNTLVHYFPWQAVIEAVFMGTGDCAHEQYHVLGLPLPAWGLLYFVAVVLVSSLLIILRRKNG
jgi:disulfide bond formation protein DsbB